MELFDSLWWSALFSIIITDLVLAGDNAILIGLAARNVPKSDQKKVIIWGTAGAIVIRLIATLAVVWLLEVPGLHLVGGLLLVWIAYNLLTEDKGSDEHGDTGTTFWAAIKTIIIADALMGLDNVLAVAGAAHGDFLLVTIGLLVSIPIVMGGSTIILKYMEKFPVIITIGAAVLAWTSSKMIVSEHFLHDYFTNPFVKYGFEILVVAGVLIFGTMKKKKNQSNNKQDKIESI